MQMYAKKALIRTHRKKLVELTYLVHLGRPAEEAAFDSAVDVISEKGYEFYLKYGGSSLLEHPIDLASLTPHARRIYADLKKAIGNKNKKFRA
jgi:hypothetical protein